MMSAEKRTILHTEFAAVLGHAQIKQAEFARYAGVTNVAVNSWCRGRKPVPIWAYQLAHTLELLLQHMSFEDICAKREFEYFETLGIWKEPSLENAHKARRELLKIYHPEILNGDSQPLQNINEAVELAHRTMATNAKPIRMSELA